MLNVRRGDRVNIHFGHHSNGDRDHIVDVERVTIRYEWCNHGETRVNPLGNGRDVDTGDSVSFDISYVTGFVWRGKAGYEPKPNVFRGHRETGLMVLRSKGAWTGPLYDLFRLALSCVGSVPLPFELDTRKATVLYERAGKPGCVGTEDWGWPDWTVHKVRPDVFRRWVQRNANKLCLTKKQVEAREKAGSIREDEAYWEDVAADSAVEFDRDFESPRNDEEPYY